MSRSRNALVNLSCGALASLLCLAACGGNETPPASRDTATSRVATSVVIIHGIGNQNAGYSKPIQDLLKAQNPSLHFVEVLWSDLGSLLRQAPAAVDKQRQKAEQELLAEINAAEQRALARRTVLPSAPSQDETQIKNEYATARGFVGPIVRYEFLSGAERRRIQQRLLDALDWSSKNADRTIVIAHSLGSVIAFDTLHGWESTPPAGNVVVLSTMGSPLGKSVFLKHRGRPVGRPANAGTWLNFHSTSDPIASALVGAYSDVADRDVQTSILPLTAHSAYWTHADVVQELLKSVR